jgi:hypothetical protein
MRRTLCSGSGWIFRAADHIVGTADQRERNGNAERFGGPEIHHQLDLLAAQPEGRVALRPSKSCQRKAAPCRYMYGILGPCAINPLPAVAEAFEP